MATDYRVSKGELIGAWVLGTENFEKNLYLVAVTAVSNFKNDRKSDTHGTYLGTSIKDARAHGQGFMEFLSGFLRATHSRSVSQFTVLSTQMETE